MISHRTGAMTCRLRRHSQSILQRCDARLRNTQQALGIGHSCLSPSQRKQNRLQRQTEKTKHLKVINSTLYPKCTASSL